MTLEYKLKNVLIAWAGSLIIVALSSFFFRMVIPNDPNWSMSAIGLSEKNRELWYPVIYACLIAPFVEEIVFRYLPLELIRFRPDFQHLKYPVIIGGSVIFGWMHGDEHHVFIQGLVGLWLYWVYLKNGFCLASSMTVHFLYNFSLAVGLVTFF